MNKHIDQTHVAGPRSKSAYPELRLKSVNKQLQGWLVVVTLTLLLAGIIPIFAQLAPPSGNAAAEGEAGGVAMKAMQKSISESFKMAVREMAAEQAIIIGGDPRVQQVPAAANIRGMMTARASQVPLEVPRNSMAVIELMEEKISALKLQVKQLEDANKTKEELVALQEQLITSLKKKLEQATNPTPVSTQ